MSFLTNVSRLSNSANPEVTITTTIHSPIGVAFDYIPPINLMHIFRGTTLIPAIVDTTIREGWDRAGLARTVRFADGSTSRETLLSVEARTAFSYKNEEFTSPVLVRLLKRLEGEWTFSETAKGHTRVEWTYRAIPTNYFAGLVVRFILMREVRLMLNKAMAIIKDDLESGQLAKGSTWNLPVNGDLVQVSYPESPEFYLSNNQ